VFSVAAATVDFVNQRQPSLARLAMDTLIVPAFKRRAKLMRSLPRPGKDGRIIFSNTINPRLHSSEARAALMVETSKHLVYKVFNLDT
jgi:hypothetical protein